MQRDDVQVFIKYGYTVQYTVHLGIVSNFTTQHQMIEKSFEFVKNSGGKIVSLLSGWMQSYVNYK